MLESWLFHWHLRRLRAKIASTHRYYRRVIRDARSENRSRDDVEGLIREHSHEVELVDDEIRSLVSARLLAQVDYYLLPRPEFGLKGEMWMESSLTGRVYLTEKGIAHVRSMVRMEKKERSELIRSWLPGITGIIGTLIGLTALLVKH